LSINVNASANMGMGTNTSTSNSINNKSYFISPLSHSLSLSTGSPV